MFIRLAVVTCQIYKIPRNSPKIRTYISSRSSKVNDLGVNRKRILYRVAQKSKPQSFVHIFVKYWPIVKIF